jgi:hypothetical protein
MVAEALISQSEFGLELAPEALMKKISLSEFKRKCSAYIRWLSKPRQTLRAMRDGEVYVEVVPIARAGGPSAPRPKKEKRN